MDAWEKCKKLSQYIDKKYEIFTAGTEETILTFIGEPMPYVGCYANDGWRPLSAKYADLTEPPKSQQRFVIAAVLTPDPIKANSAEWQQDILDEKVVIVDMNIISMRKLLHVRQVYGLDSWCFAVKTYDQGKDSELIMTAEAKFDNSQIRVMASVKRPSLHKVFYPEIQDNKVY